MRTEKPELCIAVPDGKSSGLDRIWTQNLDVVVRRIKDDHPLWSTRLVEDLVNEYRRFLTLVLLSDQAIPMCSRYVDEVWHTHILHTTDYTAFCDQVFGGYLHHTPASRNSEDQDVRGFNVFRGEYARIFGTDTVPFVAPWWIRVTHNTVGKQKALCVPSGTATICVPSGAKVLCVPSGQ